MNFFDRMYFFDLMDFFDCLKKQPKWVTILLTFIIVCISILVSVNIFVGSKIAYYNSFYINKYSRYKSDLERGILTHIVITDDIELKFDKNNSVKDVFELIENLQREYGYDLSSYLTTDTYEGKIGLKIIINKDDTGVKIVLNDKNSIEFVNNVEFSNINGEIREYVEAKAKSLKFIQLIINISLFILWNALVLIFSLMTYNIAGKISVLRFFVLNIISFIIVSCISIYWYTHTGDIYYSKPNFSNYLFMYFVVTLILYILDTLFTRPVLKEKSSSGFKIIMAVFLELPVFISILISVMDSLRYG